MGRSSKSAAMDKDKGIDVSIAFSLPIRLFIDYSFPFVLSEPCVQKGLMFFFVLFIYYYSN